MNIQRFLLSFLVIGLLTSAFSAVSQDIVYDEDYTLSYINERLDKQCQLKLERKNLVVEFRQKGELVRVDYIFPETIEPEGIYYSEEEGAVIVVCFEKAGDCIQREILKLDRKMGYSRSNLTSNCAAEDCTGLAVAVQHLIKLYTLDEYERTKPFEEN